VSQLTFGEIFGDKPAAVPPTPQPPVVESWYKGRVLSHSSISLYKTCPQKWKFRYIDKIPEAPKSFFSFGKSVHTGLEFLFERGKQEIPAAEEMLAHYKNSWIREGYETVAQERWFYQEGERILKGFYAKHHTDFAKVLEIELKFNIDVDGVPVMGYIDRIDLLSSGQVAVIDYKTGKPFDKARVRKDPQLTLYQIAVEKALGKKVESLTLYHLNSLTALTVPFHGPELEKSVRTSVVEAAKGISDGKFDPKPDAQGHCKWCDYAQICPALKGKAALA
jgi:putative RecB family exonuclease